MRMFGKGAKGLGAGTGWRNVDKGRGRGRDQACTLTTKKNKADTPAWRRSGGGVEQPKAERFEVSGMRSVRDEVKRKSR